MGNEERRVLVERNLHASEDAQRDVDGVFAVYT